jgi:hypothetical protein
MTINTSVDNAVIDFAQISNILQTLKSHDDLFTSVISNGLGNFVDDTNATTTTGAGTSTPIPANALLICTAARSVTLAGSAISGQYMPFGQTFSSTPVVITSVTTTSTSSRPYSWVTAVTPQGATVSVSDVAGKTNAAVTINLIAIGARA